METGWYRASNPRSYLPSASARSERLRTKSIQTGATAPSRGIRSVPEAWKWHLNCNCRAEKAVQLGLHHVFCCSLSGTSIRASANHGSDYCVAEIRATDMRCSTPCDNRRSRLVRRASVRSKYQLCITPPTIIATATGNNLVFTIIETKLLWSVADFRFSPH